MSREITHVEALNFINEITQAINQSDDPDSVLDQILSACMHITSAETGSIMLLDSTKERLQIIVSRGFNVPAKSAVYDVDRGVTGWVARHGRSRIVADARKESDYIALKDGLCAELVVPMLVHDEVIGVVSVDATVPEAFHAQHEQFLSIMSNLAARIFVNLRDNRQLKNRDRFHRVMLEISKVVSNSLQLNEVFSEIMGITEKAFRLHRSTLFIYNQQSDLLRIQASIGLSPKEIEAVVYAPGEGITGSVFINKKPQFIPSVAAEPSFLNRLGTVAGSDDFGFFCCPIFSGSEVVGVFSTFTRQQSGVEPEAIIEFLEILGSIISQAITIQRLVREETKVIAHENIMLKQELSSRYQFGNLIGRAAVMNRLFEKVRIIADSRASVLLTGESGTGKELIASAIHYNSPRRDQPFVKINCAAIPENLLESELFGHKKGAFTGAVADKKGKFELANGGSIFLDEIGELDLNLQSKLLRVLQEREIEPVGGRSRQVDIRVVAATNANLEEKISDKSFRADLYYRLNVINLKIPPLRERKEDILLLVQHFINKYNAENVKNLKGITPEAIQLLENYEWPGNVRQLENIIERAVVLCQNDVLQITDFQDVTTPFQSEPLVASLDSAEPKGFRAEVGTDDDVNGESSGVLELTLPLEERLHEIEGRVYEVVISDVERRLILMALKRFRYTKTQASRFLGINRNTLDKKIKDLNIEY